MSLYNTVPDLESEPLVAAPPRKHGKAMLAVVAALAFGAGALAPSAVSRVSQTTLFPYIFVLELFPAKTSGSPPPWTMLNSLLAAAT